MTAIPLSEAVGLDLGVVSGPQLFAFVTIVGMIAAIGVYLDGRRQHVNNPGIWALAVGFLFLLYALPGIGALVIYLVVRQSPTDRSA